MISSQHSTRYIKFSFIVILGISLTLIMISYSSNGFSTLFSPDSPIIQTDKSRYHVGEPILLSIINPIKNDRGILHIMTPDDVMFTRVYYSGTSGISPEYFIINRSDAIKCDCDLFGTWKIDYEPIEGNNYTTHYFVLEN